MRTAQGRRPMSRGPWKTKPSFLSNAIKGFKRGTNRSDDDICVLVNLKDGTALICAKSPGDPPAQTTDEWKLPDEPLPEVRS
jgi:hypothetical protein